jgi:hypothetical protein
MKIEQLFENLVEMPLKTYKLVGDFDKQGSFRMTDRKTVSNPKVRIKAEKFFSKCEYDFNLYFGNIRGLGKLGEGGSFSPEKFTKTFTKYLGEETVNKIIENREDAINILFVDNDGADKVPMTPWIMAHRLGHALQRDQVYNNGIWREYESEFRTVMSDIFQNYYGKTFRMNDSTPNDVQCALFNAIGTQRSSRKGRINRAYEFLYELFAQYITLGKIKLNPLPEKLTAGRRVIAKVSPEIAHEADEVGGYLIGAAEERLGYTIDNILGASLGKIFVQ